MMKNSFKEKYVEKPQQIHSQQVYRKGSVQENNKLDKINCNFSTKLHLPPPPLIKGAN